MDSIEKSSIRREVPYFQVPNSIFDLDLPLTLQDKIIYIFLSRCSNQGAQAFPSYNTMAKKCGMSKRMAQYSISHLEACGLLEKEVRPKKNKENFTNIYILNDPSAYSAPPGAHSASLPSAPGAPPSA